MSISEPREPIAGAAARLGLRPLRRAARFIYRFTTDPQYRSVALIRLTRPPNLFQPYAITAEDRYPALFTFAREQLGDGPHVRILSFGCSTGEEVFSLRRYFAAATIKGIDINGRNIATCRARQPQDAAMTFATADSTENEPAEAYDAIFCLAVLRHGKLGRPKVQRCDHLIRFARFEETVRDFARCLKHGGLLFIADSNFRFCDTTAAAQFDVDLRLQPPLEPQTPIFDRDDRRMNGATYDEVGFRKRTVSIDGPVEPLRRIDP